jgi:hypothetical protein
MINYLDQQTQYINNNVCVIKYSWMFRSIDIIYTIHTARYLHKDRFFYMCTAFFDRESFSS